MNFANRVRHILSRWLWSRRGNVAIISGLLMPCLVGFCGMGADVGYWYYRQRVLQGAADVTAYNGAVALSTGATAASIIAGGSADATSNGWQSSDGTITVNTPPATGAYKADTKSVEVLLTENEPRFFSKFFSGSTVNVSVRAVANYKVSGNACMLALDKTASNAFQFWGHNTTNLTDCNVMSDSLNNNSLGVGGSSTVTVPCAIAVGGVDVSATLNLTSCNSPTSHAEPVADPYANVPAPPIPKACTNPPGNGNLSPGNYCHGLSIKDARTLNPGVYVISGGTLDLNANANITGTNVMFYLTNGATIKFNGNAQFNLSAPTAAPYPGGQSGILFFSDRSQANGNESINGNSSSVLTGALYFPTQALTINGDYSGANGCMQVVADTITYSGNSTLSGNCSGYGMASIPVPGGITLVE